MPTILSDYQNAEHCVLCSALEKPTRFRELRREFSRSDFRDEASRAIWDASMGLLDGPDGLEKLKVEAPLTFALEDALGRSSPVFLAALDALETPRARLREDSDWKEWKDRLREILRRHRQAVLKDQLGKSTDPTECTAIIGKLKEIESGRQINSVLALESAAETMNRARGAQVALRIAGSLVMEGEHTLLFADTNLGKSILATQIALAFASGKSFSPQFETETAPKKVLYVDFELGLHQFAGRYAEVDDKTLINPFPFPAEFVRAEIDPEKLPPGDTGSLVMKSINAEVREHGFEGVVVDNITWLSDDTEKGDAASALMKSFHCLARELEITILTLAHTPKVPTHVPITINHLAGSKRLANFADSVFAIGRDWQNPDSHVYLKQLKVRSAGALEYGADNVAVMERVKPGNFLGFEFRHFASEDDICRREGDREREERQEREKSRVLAVKRENPDASLREVARLAGPEFNHMKVNRILEHCNV